MLNFLLNIVAGFCLRIGFQLLLPSRKIFHRTGCPDVGFIGETEAVRLG